ncbi:50S ribosome-binding GTPase [bacterium]|nr:50S ribosome-binding GTPase [bacterium]
MPDERWRDEPLRLVFVGRQNVGKSSLTNALLKENRALVTDMPGTTRDPVYASFTHGGRNYEVLDTAGIKRISRLKEDVDYYSLIRAEKSLRGSEVALLTLDAGIGITEQDKRVAAKIAEAGRAIVIAVNKADLLPEEQAAQEAYLDYVRGALRKLHWADVVFTSATEGTGLDELLAAARRSHENFHRRIDNAALRDVLIEAVTLSPPPVVKNRELRFYDFRQIGNCPPTFLIEMNDKKIIRQAYQRFLENTIRKHFDFMGTHVLLVWYEKRKRR